MTNKTWSEAAHRQGLETLTHAGLIDPRDERDACGVGLIADMKGRAATSSNWPLMPSRRSGTAAPSMPTA